MRLAPTTTPTTLLGKHGAKVQLVLRRNGDVGLDVQSRERGVDGHVRKSHSFIIFSTPQAQALAWVLADMAAAPETDPRQMPLRLAA